MPGWNGLAYFSDLQSLRILNVAVVSKTSPKPQSAVEKEQSMEYEHGRGLFAKEDDMSCICARLSVLFV